MIQNSDKLKPPLPSKYPCFDNSRHQTFLNRNIRGLVAGKQDGDGKIKVTSIKFVNLVYDERRNRMRPSGEQLVQSCK